MLLVVTVLIQLLLLNSARADGKGEVFFLRYKDSGGCGDKCDFYFKNVKIAIGKAQVTFYKVRDEVEGDSISNTEDVDLSSRFPNPVKVELKTNGTVAITMNVWDSDFGNDDPVRQIKGNDCLVDFSTVSTMSKWKNYKFYFDQNNNNKYLEINYRITECDDHFTLPGCNICAPTYYTVDCSVNCVPTDHRHTCDTQGQLVCGDRYQGSKCTECKGNRDGDECEDCKKGWQGANCDQCIDGHYGNKCDVTCFPKPDAYNCSETGKKICLDGHYGDDCDDTCFPKLNVYNCSNTGKKICLDGHYGLNCDEICIPKPDVYNCSETGKKICLNLTLSAASDCEAVADPNTGVFLATILSVIVILCILLIVAITYFVRKWKKSSKEVPLVICNTPGKPPNAPKYSDVLNIGEEEANSGKGQPDKGDTYTRLNRRKKINSQCSTEDMYSKVEKKKTQFTIRQSDTEYSTIDRMANASEDLEDDAYAEGISLRKDEKRDNSDTECYASVSFVRNSESRNQEIVSKELRDSPCIYNTVAEA